MIPINTAALAIVFGLGLAVGVGSTSLVKSWTLKRAVTQAVVQANEQCLLDRKIAVDQAVTEYKLSQRAVTAEAKTENKKLQDEVKDIRRTNESLSKQIKSIRSRSIPKPECELSPERVRILNEALDVSGPTGPSPT